MSSLKQRRDEILGSATKVIGSGEAANCWVRRPAYGLDSQIPAELIRRPPAPGSSRPISSKSSTASSSESSFYVPRADGLYAAKRMSATASNASSNWPKSSECSAAKQSFDLKWACDELARDMRPRKIMPPPELLIP